jgi:hypothetical protein
MSHLSVSLISSLLIAMLASGCASQDAMSLLPDNVKLDVARDKATKEGPVSVDAMMAKARTLHPETDKQTQVAAKVDVTETAALPDQSKALEQPIQTAYAEEQDAKLQHQADSSTNDDSPAKLFQQAMLLSEQAHASDQTPSLDDIKAAAAASEWRKLMDQQAAQQVADDIAKVTVASLETPLVMPLSQIEIIPVNFNEAHDALANEDDLKLKLLRFGKRLPLQITIGKVTNAQGFEVMKSAIALGNIIAQASGGAPEITYDPSLSEGAAEVRYPAIGRQS